MTKLINLILLLFITLWKDSLPVVHFPTSSFNLSSLKSIKATSMVGIWNLNSKKPIFKFCREYIFYIVILFLIGTLGIDMKRLFIVSFSNNSSMTSKTKPDNCLTTTTNFSDFCCAIYSPPQNCTDI